MRFTHTRDDVDREYQKRFGNVKTAPVVGSFADWLPAKFGPPWHWDWAYTQLIIKTLDQVTAGNIKRLMLFVPPRHGKSELVTVRYMAHRIEMDPSTRIIIGAYDQTLARLFSRKIRNIVKRECKFVELTKDRNAAIEWETTEGGGVYATGVGAGVTGRGGNVIGIDDPVKSRAEANSLAYRDRVWDWYTDDLYTRLEPNAPLILIMTRWHEDDLAGRILNSEDGANWAVLRLPAIAETQEARDRYNISIGKSLGQAEPLGRKPGEPLNPDRYDLAALERMKTVLGNSFNAIMQQAPSAPEGERFKREWFEIVPTAPFDANRLRYWDMAGTEGDGTYTVGLRMAHKDGYWYVEDVVRGQWSPGARNKIIKQTAELDRQTFGKAIPLRIEQEPGSSGKEVIQNLIKFLAEFPVYRDLATGDKDTRLEPFQAQCEALNVKLVRGVWNSAYLDEMCTIPNSQYRDQGDGSSGAYNTLVKSVQGKKKRSREY